ncbi:PIN domain-containing protein [Chryseobacterium gleum]|uniref:PIN domain-containing protein n=1 Tax=Chryseobacterium gleum TaxID=250 RepID=UPI001E57E89A|nr:hypothetical protein [Chryseobacterium gleum]MCD9617905.1 hypothetical protein [Chryseobacterium gleum]
MVNKNFNTGNIHTEGGNVSFGDTINYFDGFPILLAEYRSQLEDIKEDLNHFKIKSGITRLDKLEKRVHQNFATATTSLDKNIILSKIYYLKALALNELEENNRQEISKLFISAYKLNENDLVHRDRACVEYYSLKENAKAIGLAEKILLSDEFNLAAWFVKTLLSNDIKAYIKNDVPNSVKTTKRFSHSLIFQIIQGKDFKSFNDLNDYDITYTYDENDFGNLTLDNKSFWELNLNLLLNKFLNDNPSRYISGESNIYEKDDRIKKVFEKILKYYETLKHTEIRDNIKYYEFYYYYFKYVLYNDNIDAEQVISVYNQIKPRYWLLTIFTCQVLNHQKNFQQSIKLLADFEKENNTNVEILLLKATLLKIIGEDDDIINLVTNYIDQIDIVDEINVNNLLMSFLRLLPDELPKEVFESIKFSVLKKQFISTELKDLFTLLIDVRFINDYSEDTKQQILDLLKTFSFADGTKIMIALTLEILGERKEALLILESFVKTDEISDNFRIYLMMLINHLHDKNVDERGLSEKVTNLLRFWRLNSHFQIDDFLNIEHNLYANISDYESLIEVDSILLSLYPKEERYQFAILSDYDKIKNLDKLKEIAATLSENFNDEEYGVQIAQILFKNNIEKEKAFKILYNLASNPLNIKSRGIYFISSNLFSEFLINYSEVTSDSWIEYEINGVVNKIKLTKDSEYYKQLVGKKIEDEIIIESKFSKRKTKGKLIAIYNDGVELMKNILEDVHKPINDFGFESFNFPTGKPEELNKALIELFGEEGTRQKEYRNSQLKKYFSYQLGFTEITLSIFKSNYLESYLSLTTSKDVFFTTLLNETTADIKDNHSFSLDYSTILLFYFLEIELGFDYIHKFIIPLSVVEDIERELATERIDRESKMSVEITTEGVQPYFLPDNFKEKRIEFLESVLQWLNKRCIIDLVKEKNDYLPKLFNDSTENISQNDYKIFIDSLMLSQRKKHYSISSDSTVFLFNRSKVNIRENILNPEKYLNYFYKNKCNLEFYKYLLKHNYLSIDISAELLTTEFNNYTIGKENYYFKVLNNIQFYIHQNENKYNDIVVSFIENIYLNNNFSDFWKGRYVFDFLRHYLLGMPKDDLNEFWKEILTKFHNEYPNYWHNLFSQLVVIRNVLLKK